MINYRYNVLKILGEGGSGVVFLVEDTLNQCRQSAMKILHTERASNVVNSEQLKNEVSVLATLHHPNLVRVFDSGIVHHADDPFLQGRRFFTMEYIQGQDALQWYRGIHNDRERVAGLKHLLLQVLDVLSYIHHQGVIHFDIKPENLLLVTRGMGEDGFPVLKLTDFGFSIRQNDSFDFPLRGTLEYTAPELLRHEAFDHRVDLYSLGATVFHLIEGRCPFEAHDPVELIKKVLTSEYVFDKSCQGEYASFVPLMDGLMKKDPMQRFGFAREAEWSFISERERTHANMVKLSTKPMFVGREEERGRISTALSLLEHGREDEIGEVAIVISGPEGIGKTALLGEAKRVASSMDIAVLEANTTQKDVPFGAIQSLLLLLRAETMSRSSEGLSLAEKYAHVIDHGHAAGESAMSVQREWIRERDKVIEAQARFINLSSLLFPYVLIIDNADHLDPESVEVVRIASRDAKPGRFLLLASERGESLDTAPMVRMQLRELDAAHVKAMSVSVVSPMILGEAIGDHLFPLYGGSPALVVEALHSVERLLPVTTLSVSADTEAMVESVLQKLPRDIDQFLVSRYKAFDRGMQLCIEILSCIRSSIDLQLIQSLLPFQHHRTSEYMSSLEAEGFLLSHEGGMRFSMRHARLKMIVNSELAQTRQDVHLFIASTMEQRTHKHSFSDLQELAYQYANGGKRDESVGWCEKAADEGVQLAAYRRAWELYEEGLAMCADKSGEVLDRLRVKLANAMFHSGGYLEAIGLADTLLIQNNLDEMNTYAVHKTAGLAHSKLGDFGESKRHILDAFTMTNDIRERLELQQELVGIDLSLGNAAEAERVSLSQLEQAQKLGDQRIVALIHTDLGIATFLQDQFDRSVGYFQEAMKTYSGSGQYARLADAMMNTGNVMSAKGEIATAIENWDKALAISQEYGTLNQQGQIHNNLGIAHFKLKRYGEARQFYNNARKIFARIESKQGTAFVLTNLGELCFAECEYEKALHVWEEVQEIYRGMNDARGLMETLLQIAQVRQVLGDCESAVNALHEAETLMSRKGLETFRSSLLFHRGTLMMSIGRLEEALQIFASGEEQMSTSDDEERKLLLVVRRAECNYRLGNIDSAVLAARHALQSGERGSMPHIIAESTLVLAMIARESPQSVQEKALTFLKQGMDAIEKEPIAEFTWKIAFALGKEFHERGQGERAMALFLRAKLVLQFIVKQFESIELKNKYLAAEKKEEVLNVVERFFKKQGEYEGGIS